MSNLHTAPSGSSRLINIDLNGGWDLDMDMDLEDEQNVEDSLPSTPLEERSTSTQCRACKYATMPDEGELLGGTSKDTSDPTHHTHSQQEDHIPFRGDTDERDNDKTCRICFSGPEEEDMLGRMISPCLCTGSMRYVHVKCLNAWRGTGTNAVKCPQCHYRYQLRRTLISGLATSRPILLLSTILTFSLLTLLLGEILHLMLHHSPTISRTLLSRSSRPTVKSMFDLLDDPYTAVDGGPVIVVGGGGALIWDIFIGAIQTFIDLSNSFLTQKDNLSTKIPSPIANLIFELAVRYLLGLATLGSMSFLSLLLSLSLFGPLQLMNGLRGFGFLGNFARRRTAAGGGGGGGGEGRLSVGTIMMIVLVLVGAVNTLIQFYNGLQILTQKLLIYVETQILEVNSDEIHKRRREQRKKREEEKMEQRWWIRWIKDGQFKRVDGYKELAVRFSLMLDRIWERVKRLFRMEGEGNHDHQE
ncbi:hypothetical protein L486_06069 [Kwoniella mangroviensis CBS 10435]|uniref:Uncharacterized protein n=1 Tax=Kwoniella mangroviensis CBS 10435 TaxID=1331196 RepID=A0A1B9IKD0_9TREE|nr:hypothetical protein L486_06069 [Kwoniella mangroviensis CBS 10435]